MLYREIFPDTEPAREYAIRMSKSDAPPYEFDLVQEEIDALQAGKTIVLVVLAMIKRIRTQSCLPVNLMRHEMMALPTV